MALVRVPSRHKPFETVIVRAPTAMRLHHNFNHPVLTSSQNVSTNQQAPPAPQQDEKKMSRKKDLSRGKVVARGHRKGGILLTTTKPKPIDQKSPSASPVTSQKPSQPRGPTTTTTTSIKNTATQAALSPGSSKSSEKAKNVSAAPPGVNQEKSEQSAVVKMYIQHQDVDSNVNLIGDKHKNSLHLHNRRPISPFIRTNDDVINYGDSEDSEDYEDDSLAPEVGDEDDVISYIDSVARQRQNDNKLVVVIDDDNESPNSEPSTTMDPNSPRRYQGSVDHDLESDAFKPILAAGT